MGNESEEFVTLAVILNYNSSRDSVALFRDLEELHLSYLGVLVIDNNSTEEDQEYLKDEIPSEKLILNKKNKGYSAGNNVGIEVALKRDVKYIWLLNPDIRIEKETLPILLNTMAQDKNLAAVGPRINLRNSPDIIFSEGEILLMDESCSTFHKNSKTDAARVPKKIDYNVDYIDGSCILLSSRAIREVGNLPEKYFLYFEETHWCFNARKHDWKLAVNSNALVYNLISIKGAKYFYYFFRNKLIFAKEYHPNFIAVRNYYVRELLKEAIFRLKGKYFKPFYCSRLKGIISGVLKTSL